MTISTPPNFWNIKMSFRSFKKQAPWSLVSKTSHASAEILHESNLCFSRRGLMLARVPPMGVPCALPGASWLVSWASNSCWFVLLKRWHNIFPQFFRSPEVTETINKIWKTRFLPLRIKHQRNESTKGVVGEKSKQVVRERRAKRYIHRWLWTLADPGNIISRDTCTEHSPKAYFSCGPITSSSPAIVLSHSNSVTEGVNLLTEGVTGVTFSKLASQA